MLSTPAARFDRGLLATCVLLFVGACAQVPADAPPTRSANTDERVEPDAPASTQAAPGACPGADLKPCLSACSDKECLAWCSSDACATALASLHACMDEAEQRIAAEHPEPRSEYEDVEIDGEPVHIMTPESSARLSAWHRTKTKLRGQHWENQCRATCLATVASPASDGDEQGGFCHDWAQTYGNWRYVLAAPSDMSGRLLTAAGMFGSSMALAGPLASQTDARANAVANLIADANSSAMRWHKCVPDVEDARDFTVHVEFDEHGELATIAASDGPPDMLACIERMVAADLSLPPRVAQDYPTLELLVRIKKPSDSVFGGAFDDLGALQGPPSNWGGLDDDLDPWNAGSDLRNSNSERGGGGGTSDGAGEGLGNIDTRGDD